MVASQQPRISDPEFLSFNTIAILARPDDGTLLGTGFFYQFLSGGEIPIPAIVTNRHVLEDALATGETITIVFNPADKSGNFDMNGLKLPFQITDLKPMINNHPNPKIDLAFLPVNGMFSKLADRGDPVYATFFRRENLPKPEEWAELTALEDVVIIGYPAGVRDRWNNLPIFRRGITATHPKIDFEQRPEFLIDAAIYEGSSGSPVVLYKKTDIMMGRDLNLGKDKPRLVGILSKFYSHTETGEMRSTPIPAVRKRVPAVKIPDNIGTVIKSTELDGFIPLIDKKLAEQRELSETYQPLMS